MTTLLASLPCLYQYISIDIFINILFVYISNTLINNIIRPSLLTKTELEWILGKNQISKSFEYKIKISLRKKIDQFLNFELPLLIQNQILDKQLIQDISNNSNDMVPTS